MQTAVKGLHRSCRVPEPGGESTEGHWEIAASTAKPRALLGSFSSCQHCCSAHIHTPFLHTPSPCCHPHTTDGHHGTPAPCTPFCCLSSASHIVWVCTSHPSQALSSTKLCIRNLHKERCCRSLCRAGNAESLYCFSPLLHNDNLCRGGR